MSREDPVCPNCDHPLRYRDRRTRIWKWYGGEKRTIQVRRMHCKKCHCLHTELPSSMKFLRLRIYPQRTTPVRRPCNDGKTGSHSTGIRLKDLFALPERGSLTCMSRCCGQRILCSRKCATWVRDGLAFCAGLSMAAEAACCGESRMRNLHLICLAVPATMM